MSLSFFFERPSFLSSTSSTLSSTRSDAQSAPPELERVFDRICDEYAEWVVRAGKQLPPEWSMPGLVRTVIGDEAIHIPGFIKDSYVDVMLYGQNSWLCNEESLATFRNVIAAENEAEIYERIRVLENQHYYNIPPHNNPGDYARLVREHFDQALNVDHYWEIFDREYLELRVLDKKAGLQDKLLNLMLDEQNLARIMELSPYSNKQVNLSGRNLEIYREFYSHFTDDEFRRQQGLPLP
ncbi:unnamed protein product [Vicia faba]|uniref:Uncharacterized protein n=1 Tax=Vicia faba TaxID=3906 RepID=A0AAV0ZPU3_VICFA|nr:unnamed protein product [Vicia faba]